MANMALKKALIGLGTGTIKPVEEVGICSNVRGYLMGTRELLDLMAGWPKHSGSRTHPIPATHKRCTDSYEQYALKGYLWKGKQLALRRELCLFIASQLED